MSIKVLIIYTAAWCAIGGFIGYKIPTWIVTVESNFNPPKQQAMSDVERRFWEGSSHD